MTALPAPPERSFASDNSAGVHPRVLEAMISANEGHAVAYGADPWTQGAEARFRELFGASTVTRLVWSGTGANVLALASTLRPAECVVCAEGAHIAVDETGAPERVLGAKILTLPTADGKLRPEQLEPLHHLIGAEHHAQPGVLSITQSTESGTLYSADEIGGLSEVAHRMGMRVHLDGARIANATAALGGSIAALRSFTVDAGVDVVSFGGTKAGMAHGEAVVYLDPALAARSRYLRKNVTQLPSKMRFIAAQFTALLDDGLWIDLATHANAMARTLYDATRDIPGVEFARAPAVNSVFPVLPPDVIEPLMAWSFFWPWDMSRNEVRWMTAWDTTEADVARFAAGVRAALA
ncbi:MAG: threonine aldolase family protein [Actinomycetota bacterium]